MKIIKRVNVNKEIINLNVSKAQAQCLKVLENIGLLRIFSSKNNSAKLNALGLEFNKSIINKINIVFIKELPMSCDTIRTLNSKSKINNNQGNSVSNKINLIRVPGIVTFIFTTEKGILSQSDCIKYGIGGKLFSYVIVHQD